MYAFSCYTQSNNGLFHFVCEERKGGKITCYTSKKERSGNGIRHLSSVSLEWKEERKKRMEDKE